MKNRAKGMTLLELMTALTVLGILVAIALPSFRQYTAGARTVAATNDLVTALNLARSEALRRSGNAVVCVSSDGATCTGGNNWSQGWVAFADANRNGSVDAGELLQVWQGVDGNLAFTASAANGDAVSSVVYNAMGMGQLPAGGRIRFSVVAPSCVGNRAGQTDVTLSGSIQSTKVACP